MRTFDSGIHCLESRRLLLSAPREHVCRAHRCESCAAFACELVDADRKIEETLLVSVPEGLDYRILLTHAYMRKRG
jgi:hypothetical protein